MARLTAVSLFSGCGAMDQGLTGGFVYLGRRYSRHPVRVVYAIDNDRYACDIYNANFSTPCTLGDVGSLRPEDIPVHQILFGGFPCQSFSIVAQNPPRLGYDDSSTGRLVLEMCRIAREAKPSCIIAENVKGILHANGGRAFPLILQAFEEAGYFVRHALLDASDYGVPQRRERVFIVGFRRPDSAAAFEFPEPVSTVNKIPLSLVLEANSEISDRYWFSDRAVQGMLRVRDKMNKGRAQRLDQPCNTVSAHLAKVSLNSVDPVLAVGERYRRFTPREVARIQSFPDSFTLVGSDTRQYRAIGNAVPPVLMWYVAREVIKILRIADPVLLAARASRTAAEIRSYNMSQIRSKNTGPELMLRSKLSQRGWKFRLCDENLCGKPDIVFPEQKVAVFCDSAFWHGRNAPETIARIKSNTAYWEKKIRRNIARDQEVTLALERDGWSVIRVWDEDIQHDLPGVVASIESMLSCMRRCSTKPAATRPVRSART